MSAEKIGGVAKVHCNTWGKMGIGPFVVDVPKGAVEDGLVGTLAAVDAHLLTRGITAEDWRRDCASFSWGRADLYIYETHATAFNEEDGTCDAGPLWLSVSADDVEETHE